MTRRYEGPRPVTKASAEKVFRHGSSEEIAQTLVDVAFSELDRNWAQERFFDFLRAGDWRLWGISAICLGHLLRSSFSIDLETAIPLIEAARRDGRSRGQANDALGDIRQLHPALVHDRDVRARARLAQALRQWLRGAPGLTPGNLWTLLPDNEAPLAKLLDAVDNREASPEERSRIDAEANALLEQVQIHSETITLWGDELDAFRELVREHAVASEIATALEVERSLAVLGCAIPTARQLLDEANRGGEVTPSALATVLAAMGF